MNDDEFWNGGHGSSATQLTKDRRGRRWAAAFSVVVSLGLLVAVALQFQNVSVKHFITAIPKSPTFWFCFAAYYFAQPAGDWLIYRRLWGFPVSACGALVRKLVTNELILGYLGEAQFYAWVRSRLDLAAAPFGAIKDVSIISAVAGHLLTFAVLIAVWPLLPPGQISSQMRPAFLSLGIVLVVTFAILILRPRLFSLPPRDLCFIMTVQSGRLIAMLGLLLLMWHLALPAVPPNLWLNLAALRMLVSRLPLLPNKEAVFSGMAVLILGRATPVAELMAVIAGAILAAHLLVGAVFAIAEIAQSQLARAFRR